MDVANPTAGDGRPMHTAETLAERLSLSPRTVRTMLANGVIPSYVVEHARRVDPADVDTYLASRRCPGAVDARAASVLGSVADAIADVLAGGELDDASRATLASLSRALNAGAADLERGA